MTGTLNRVSVCMLATFVALFACKDATTKAEDDLQVGTWESDSVIVNSAQGVSLTMRIKLILSPGVALTELRQGNLYSNGSFVQDSGPTCSATTAPQISGNTVSVTHVDPPQLSCLRLHAEHMTAVYTRQSTGNLFRHIVGKPMTLRRVR